ncbi:hypothetical protein [Stackebrandtia nassauensis]|uniref:Uncharacterized protein n=1 Tax=Stackebrandtia nassauensis (strain DSM 44728 / CIP 108903 / NRRL B-16338 / NBRC 102104 / LLR-40K-21) TaxID=446470 RepID=D3QAX9_STANL|nr:hypothetical protein [Stackebrandtia nassauensis]ADD44775.1 hypothetical protein Snas_5140 [Stackebrandtia nassauensis DSM 44728]
MRASGPRSARAKRRSQSRHHVAEHAPRPDGWPDGELLAETLDLNPLARTLLEEMKPEVMRTILQRLDVQVRKAMLEPHNIPVTKVSLRAASQVLTLLRAEDKPAESMLLGGLLAPAADLFNDATVGRTQWTGLRLKLVDLALPLIVNSESTFRGLRTWHRWCEDSFEDITLVAVIGQHCSHAGLAAAYLAHSYPEIKQRYESLRAQYPRLPEVFDSRLTSSNPLSRYLAARPDRKLPNTAAELRMLLREDNRVRQAEIEQMRRQRAKAAAERERLVRQREDALTRHVEVTEEPRPTVARPDPLTTPSDPGLAALPSVAEWAAAVTDSRALTQRIINGEPPSITELRSIVDLSLRLRNMATVAARVLGEEVKPNRSDIDRALTVILSDAELSAKLGTVPQTVADVTAALERLEPVPGERAEAPRTGSVPAEAPETASPSAELAAARSAAATGRPETVVTTEPDKAASDPSDLSDLDSILHGEAGARLVALAGTAKHAPVRESSASRAEDDEPDPTDDEDDEQPAIPSRQAGTATAATVSAEAPPEDPEAAELEHRLVTAASWARHPGGAMSEDYAATLSRLDVAAHLDPDPRRRLVVAASALPMALLDPASGATKLLDIEVPELADWPHLVSLRRLIGEFTRNGGSLYAPDLQLQALLSYRLSKIRYRARQIRETAGTRTLKYDKATKVYRAWFTPGGRLRPLLDCLESTEFSKLQVLVDDAAKVGAVRSINETLSELFDKGKPRIVAGARQSLVDSYDEVVNLGTSTLAVHRTIVDRANAQHDAHRRFQRATDFGDQVEKLREGVSAELEGPHPPPRAVWLLVNRALGFQHHIHPLTGPEPSIEWVLDHADSPDDAA